MAALGFFQASLVDPAPLLFISTSTASKKKLEVF
jgi:hypothetical protein